MHMNIHSSKYHIWKTKLCVYSTLFLHISLSILHNYDVKRRNFMFYEGREQEKTI